MERKEFSPRPDNLIDPAVLTIIVRYQIEQIIRDFERKEFISNMNA